MNTKLFASIAVFALLAGIIGASTMHSVYAADYGMGNKADTKKTDAKKDSTSGMAMTSDKVSVDMTKGSSSNTKCADKCYTPSSVQVKVGGTVTWKNADTAAHTVTSGKSATSDGVFDSGMVMAGKTFSYKFAKAGTFDYFCMVHPWMTGKVTVGDQKMADTKTAADKKETGMKSDKKADDAKKPSEKTDNTKKTDAKKDSTSGMAMTSDKVSVDMTKGSSSNTKCADKCYTPSSVQVKVGGTVTWKNADTAAHTVTSGKSATSDGVFDSGMVMAGKTFSYKFAKAGTFDYFCMVHPWMTGKVTAS